MKSVAASIKLFPHSGGTIEISIDAANIDDDAARLIQTILCAVSQRIQARNPA